MLQSGQQLRGVHAVILNGVGRPGHLRPLQTGQGVEHLDLHILRQGGGEPLNVNFLRVQPHGLQKELVPGLVRKAHHLILNGGAIPGTNPLNDPGEEGGPVQVGPDDGVGFLVGIGDVAAHPVGRGLLGLKGEGHGILVPHLTFQLGKVDGPGVHPGGRARLKPAEGEPRLAQAFCELIGAKHAVRAAPFGHRTQDGLSPQVGP